MPENLVGLFPPLSPTDVGGVQESGRIARDGLRERFQEAFVPLCVRGRKTHTPSSSETKSPLKAARAARALHPAQILVWHIGMLKLLPLIGSKARITLFMHGIEVWKDQSPLLRRLTNRVDLFLSNSDYTWERFLTHRPDLTGASHQTVHLGIGSPEPARSEARDPAALMIGRLPRTEDYKGHRQIIRAWKSVTGAIDSARLDIAGEGDLKSDLMGLAREVGVSSKVRFLGHIAEQDKINLLRRGRALVMPSQNEGFGLVYLEAMRHGTPCLVGENDAGREVVGAGAGISVDPDDAEKLTAALVQLLSPGPEWTGRSQAARSRYEKYFTASHFVGRLSNALSGTP